MVQATRVLSTMIRSSFSAVLAAVALSFAAGFGVASGLTAPIVVRKKKQLLKQEQSDGNSDEECIYLDYNGTTQIHPLVLEAMLPFLTRHFGNPSSSHAFGCVPKQAVDQARTALLNMLGAPRVQTVESIWFTGCGTESDNLAIRLALLSCPSPSTMKKKHVVTTNVEHPAIEECLKQLVKDGFVEVTFVPVTHEGRVTAQDVLNAIRPETVLVTVMLANNESGAIMPVKDIAQACRLRGILCHSDAAQAIGKMSVTLESLGDIDMITLVGHKIGAPKGIAALYVRPNCLFEHGRNLREGGIVLLGGGQEFGRRGGTENVAYIAGMGRAAKLVQENWKRNAAHMEAMRQRLLDNLTNELGTDMVRPNGPPSPNHRLPNTLSVGLKNVQSGELLSSIGTQVAASAGAACHSSDNTKGGISAILQAMQVPLEYARGTLRLSVGPTTTAHDVDRAAQIIATKAKEQLAKRAM